MTISSVDPATGETIREWTEMTDAEVRSAVEASAAAWREWSRRPVGERARLVRRAAEILRDGRERYARLMVAEMGKPIAQARSEVDKCAWVCEYYADEGPAFLADEERATDAARSFVAYRPLGTVLAVMPWNFPFWQVFRFAAPALVAGNAGLLKHASNVFGCAEAIEEVFRGAGVPEGVFRMLAIGGGAVEAVIRNRSVAAVTLTGSTPAGRAVASAAGSEIKKSVLELGGSDPYLVLEDADLERAVPICVSARLINAGQSCIAAKRFVVLEEVRDAFVERFVAEMRSRKMGDPLDEGNDLGPQARVELRDELHDQVVRSVEAGAELLLGGEIPDRPGAWYPPTVLLDPPEGSPARDEETFGPVAAIVTAADEDEAVAIANSSCFGLGAAVFTGDRERGERIARERLEAGCCFVNQAVRSDPRLPFGGVKLSGYGRELGREGIREFVNAKTVWVE